MQAKAMTPDEMSTVLRDELAAGKFYVIGFDEGRKRHTFPIISTAAPSAPLPSAISAVSLEMPRLPLKSRRVAQSEPKEMLHAMLQWRVDDITQERDALSHLVRDESQGDVGVGKEGRATIKAAIAEGQKNLKANL